MSSRVFISYRSSDGTDKATALARDLDALFGHDQVFLDKEDLPAGSRWRDEITRTLHGSPILLVLVTPNYLGARDSAGGLCITRADDPVRDELEAALAANAHIIPVLCDGVTETPPVGSGLPAPFSQLAERTWRRLRSYDWREDMGRLGDDLRSLGVVPRAEQAAQAAREGPPTVPMPLADAVTAVAAPSGASPGRRIALATAAAVLLGGGAYAAFRWQRARAANLTGRWRASIGARGATTARDGQIVLLSIEHQGRIIHMASSAVNIERDRDWENYRDFWKEQHGTELKRVFYRGDGEVRDEDEEEAADERAASGVPRGLRRLVVTVRVEVPGGAGEPIDGGALRATIDADDRRMRGRLWLNSEQAERVVDLRRES